MIRQMNVRVYKPKVSFNLKIVNYKKFVYQFGNKIEITKITNFQDLITLINETKNNSVNTKTLKIKKGNEWINQNIIDMIKLRDRAYNKKIKNPENHHFETQFRQIKNRVNNLIKSAKNMYLRKKWESTGTDTKKQWKFINRFFGKQTEANAIECIEINGKTLHESTDIVESFNQYFVGIGEAVAEELNHDVKNLGISGDFDEILCGNMVTMLDLTNKDEINEIFHELKKNSAPGNDEVSVRDVINLKNFIVEPIVSLINHAFTTGIFPKELKVSKVCPIFKKGKKKLMNNYRPISVVSVLSKIVEKVIKKRMIKFLTNNSLFDKFQYGFIQGSSALSATFDFVNFVSKAVDQRKIVIAVSIDLSKAFDTVNIDILLKKLHRMGFREQFYNILETYLKGRRQYVRMGGTFSSMLPINYGVPQGSVLGPLLYLLFVHSLRLVGLEAQYFTFADDTLFVYTGESENDLENLINEDLDRYIGWLYLNKLKINVNKTKFIILKQKNKAVNNINLKINEIELEQVTSLEYLGLIIDEYLNWKAHTNKIISKINPMIPIIYQCRNYISLKTKKQIYAAFFSSHLRYLLPIWGTCGSVDFNKMQILQNKILKILFKYDYLTSTNILHQELSIPKLEALLKLEQCKLMYKILKNIQKSNIVFKLVGEVHGYETRFQTGFYISNSRTNVGLNGPANMASKVYNNLSEDIRSTKCYSHFIRKCKACLNA
ncbi:hypothetical protein WA026_022748 [Henosepilachna vigintioctopunctata]|uniref:Reverse transcriptase domain-containing protein n=1 Tax=Henosepilachna vigintioctopunctata TaxID=420089 RepID=A0AAW1UJ05_9CUCU